MTREQVIDDKLENVLFRAQVSTRCVKCWCYNRIQGKRNFEFMSYGSRVIGPNIKWPHGGAITALSGKFGAEVHCWHPRNVCAQFGSDRTSGTRD